MEELSSPAPTLERPLVRKRGEEAKARLFVDRPGIFAFEDFIDELPFVGLRMCRNLSATLTLRTGKLRDRIFLRF
ncbi:MAG: hypothetical protein WCL50_17250 [Spirochaetota bacterium]